MFQESSFFNNVFEKAIHLSQSRRSLSLVAAKAQSACLLGRVSKVGEAFRQAAKRREWVRREEERMKERRIFWQANVCELGLSRRGQFMIPI